MDKVTAKIAEIPDCDFCSVNGIIKPAVYDGRTIYGAWAYMCEEHFKRFGVGLGLGKGQKLIKEEQTK